LIGAIVWNLMTWLFGLPSSSSHALFGGLIGAVIVGAGIASVNGWVIVSKVLLPAVVAPLVAGIAAAWATRLAYRITRRTPGVHTGTGFRYGQAFTSSMVALAHGTSDGQKTMGVITLVLIAAKHRSPHAGARVRRSCWARRLTPCSMSLDITKFAGTTARLSTGTITVGHFA
jgi:inorganic phosphate transporter, PiT family